MFSQFQEVSKVGSRLLEGAIVTAIIAFCSHSAHAEGAQQLEIRTPGVVRQVVEIQQPVPVVTLFPAQGGGMELPVMEISDQLKQVSDSIRIEQIRDNGGAIEQSDQVRISVPFKF